MIEEKEYKGHEGLYRGMRYGVGAPPDNEVSEALKKLVGAKITDTGFLSGQLEGGLTLDYEIEGTEFRLVIGYNDLGEWVQWDGLMDDFSLDKI